MRSDSCVKVMPYIQMKFLAKKTIQNVTSDKCTGFWTNKTVKRESKTQLAQSIFFSLVRTETLLRGTEELKSHESLKLSLTSEPKMYLHINCCCV